MFRSRIEASDIDLRASLVKEEEAERIARFRRGFLSRQTRNKMTLMV